MNLDQELSIEAFYAKGVTLLKIHTSRIMHIGTRRKPNKPRIMHIGTRRTAEIGFCQTNGFHRGAVLRTRQQLHRLRLTDGTAPGFGINYIDLYVENQNHDGIYMVAYLYTS